MIKIRLKPKRAMIGRAVVFITNAPAAPAKVKSPAWKALSPNPSCKRSASRNGLAPITRRENSPPTVEAVNVLILRSDRSRIAFGVRRA
jgi:hypothetical protein